jgi:MoxR-like ATPase
MTRHTDTWVFNIDSEVWDDCLGHETGDEGDEDVTPRFGFTDTDDVSPDDFRVGDTVLARIVSDDSGIGAVFEVREIVSADTTSHSVPGYDFEWIVFCDTVQDEFTSIYRENWERFAEVSNTDLEAVKPLATRNVVNLSPEYKQTYINGLLEHDSVTEAVRTRLEDSRKSGDEDVPSVWIEKTEIEGRDYKQDGDLRLGSAIYSATQDKQGRDVYATMREAEVGDIVLHLLQDKEQLVGISLIDSELETDFQGLPEFDWADNQKGYLRWLADFQKLNEPIRIYDEVLDRSEYRPLLDKIRGEYTKIFYDKNQQLVQGGYFTQCPKQLVDLLAAESSELRKALSERGYHPDSPLNVLGPADEYEGVRELTNDVADRLTRTRDTSNWLRDRLTDSIVRDWTEALFGLNGNTAVTPATAVKFEQIRALYEECTEELETTAEELQSGTYNSLSPGATMFIGLFRCLQAEAGVTPNLNAVRFRVIRNEQYRVAPADKKPDTIDPDHPLAAHIQETDARIYKLTAPPDNWLTAYEYAVFAFRESDHGQWEDLSPGDVVLFHSRSEPAWEALDEQASCILGAGIIGALTTKSQDDSWWYDERPNSPKDQSFPYLVTFERLYATGDIEDIEFSRSILSKDTTEANADLTALTANGMPFETADAICNETVETGFPRHRIQEPLDTTADSEPGRSLVNAITAHLKEVPPVAIHKSFTGDLDTESLLDGLYFPDELGETIIEQIQAALQAGDHIILTGPPGTGKTEIADRVAQSLADRYPYLYSGAELTTATADWSTFDTVGGYMPTETGADDATGDLAFKPGIILNRLKDTTNGTQANEPIIIDELNRADIDKAFGQLFTLLSGQSVQLPYTRKNREIELLTNDQLEGLPAAHQYAVPNAWRIFATMNTYDKTSLYEMSYAFMRRFAFIRVPAPDLPRGDDEQSYDALMDIMDQYVAAWDELDPSEAQRRAVGRVWTHTNHAVEDRSIGPAIVYDLLAYITARHTSANELSAPLTEAVISYIFPQLEGVPERTKIVAHIADVDAVDRDMLAAAARDMLQVTLSDV